MTKLPNPTTKPDHFVMADIIPLCIAATSSSLEMEPLLSAS